MRKYRVYSNSQTWVDVSAESADEAEEKAVYIAPGAWHPGETNLVTWRVLADGREVLDTDPRFEHEE